MRKNRVISLGCLVLVMIAVMAVQFYARPRIDGETLANELIQAISRKEAEAVRQLLDRGASPNYQMPKSEGGGTVLMVASLMGNAEIVKLLLARGADGSVSDEKNRSAVFFAVMQGDVNTLSALMVDEKSIQTVNKSEVSTGFTALQVATDREDAIMTDMLLKMGANPKAINAFGQSVESMCMSRKDSACNLVNNDK